MARRIVPINLDNIEDIPLPCRNCYFWERDEKAEVPQEKTENFLRKKEWFVRALEEWGECGKLLYLNKETLAYAQYAPLSCFPQNRHFRARPINTDAVFLSCIYVIQPMRGRGIGRVVLQSVLKDLYRRDLKNVEAFASRSDSYKSAAPLSFYLKNGFYIVKDDTKFPLVRIELKTAITWRVNLQVVLDGLKIPVHVPAPTQ